MHYNVFKNIFKSVLLCAAICLSAAVVMISCGRESKAEKMRREKAEADSLSLVRARRTIVYSDSLLGTLLPKADSLMRNFSYEKQEAYEDNGYYTHKLLVTGRNANRFFLQAQTDDKGRLTVRSYYFGQTPVNHTGVRIEAADVYAEAEGSLHSFEAEGIHEIVSIKDADGAKLLEFVAAHSSDRIKVTAYGSQKAVYYLKDNEKQALIQTLELSLTMKDIATTENAIRISAKQAETLEKRLEKYRKTTE